MIGSKLVSRYVTAVKHGGPFKKGQPRIILVHSTESPQTRGRAITDANYVANKNLSAHYFIDPWSIVQGLSEDLIGFGAGDVNTAAIHVEFCGYAHWSTADWTTPNGLLELQRGADLIRDIGRRLDIPIRWLSDAQLIDAYRGVGVGGLSTHWQATKNGIGTTHVDPGPNFPYALLLNLINNDQDVLEWIMSLPGAPAGLTYQQFLRNIADTVLNTPMTTMDYSVRPPVPREGTVKTTMRDNSNFSSGAAYNAGQASNASKAALKELQEGMKE